MFVPFVLQSSIETLPTPQKREETRLWFLTREYKGGKVGKFVAIVLNDTFGVTLFPPFLVIQ